MARLFNGLEFPKPTLLEEIQCTNYVIFPRTKNIRENKIVCTNKNVSLLSQLHAIKTHI